MLSGKIKTVALTNFDTERLQKILENGIPVVSNQVNVSPMSEHYIWPLFGLFFFFFVNL